MNLLYLASIDFPMVKARAIQIVNTCDALARAGCQVTLVVGRRGRWAELNATWPATDWRHIQI